jgi:hypothetical protein
MVRERKVGIVALFWTAVLGVGESSPEPRRSPPRAYQRTTGQRLEESFYDRFTLWLEKLLKAEVV